MGFKKLQVIHFRLASEESVEGRKRKKNLKFHDQEQLNRNLEFLQVMKSQ